MGCWAANKDLFKVWSFPSGASVFCTLQFTSSGVPPLAAASDADLTPTQRWLDQECSDVAEAHEFLVRHWMVDWVIGSRTFSGQSILDYNKHPDW